MEALEEDELSDSSYALTKDDVGNGRIMSVCGCMIAYGKDSLIHSVGAGVYIYLVAALAEQIEFYIMTGSVVTIMLK